MAEAKEMKKKKVQKLIYKEIKKNPLKFLDVPSDMDFVFYDKCYKKACELLTKEHKRDLKKIKNENTKSLIEDNYTRSITAFGDQYDLARRKHMEKVSEEAQSKKKSKKTIKEEEEFKKLYSIRSKDNKIMLNKQSYPKIIEMLEDTPMRFADIEVDHKNMLANEAQRIRYSKCYETAVHSIHEICGERIEKMQKQGATLEVQKARYLAAKRDINYLEFCRDRQVERLAMLEDEEDKNPKHFGTNYSAKDALKDLIDAQNSNALEDDGLNDEFEDIDIK